MEKCGLIPEGLRLRRVEILVVHRHCDVYAIPFLLQVLEQLALNTRDEGCGHLLTR